MLKIFTRQQPVPVQPVEQPVRTSSPHPDVAPVRTPAPTTAEAPRVSTIEDRPLTSEVALPPPKVVQEVSASLTSEIVSMGAKVSLLAERVEKMDVSVQSMGKRVLSVEDTYKQLLAEDQASIRDMVQHIRSLENRQFREDILKPLVGDLIGLADAFEQLRELYAGIQPSSSQQAIEWMEALDAALSSVMNRCGLVRMSRDVSAVDTRRQKIIRVDRVAPCKDGEILSIERDGYEWGGQVLRPQEVTVRIVG